MIEAAEAAIPRRRRRHRFRDAIRDLHFLLRTEHDSPRRQAAAIALGVIVGCLPLWGLHLALCAILARLFGVSRLNTYLAAWINNPISAPFLFWGGFAIGHRLLSGDWPALSVSEVTQPGPLAFGTELMFGSAVMGVILGLTLGALTYGFSRRQWKRQSDWMRLAEATAARFATCGILHWEFVRGKLLYDPLYRELARRLAPRGDGTIVDLGCGRGIALVVVDTARRLTASARDTASAPCTWIGVEHRTETARVAAAVLAGRAVILELDISAFAIPECDVVLLLDVLHYLDAAAQERLLGRAAAAISRGGILLIREPDAAGGLRFQCTRAAERARAMLRGDLRRQFHYRAENAWIRLLEGFGLAVSAAPSLAGTPFANHLIEARATERSG